MKSAKFDIVVYGATGFTGQLVAEVHSVQVMYDFATERSMPISDERRRQIEAFEGKSLTVESKRSPKARA